MSGSAPASIRACTRATWPHWAANTRGELEGVCGEGGRGGREREEGKKYRE